MIMARRTSLLLIILSADLALSNADPDGNTNLRGGSGQKNDHRRRILREQELSPGARIIARYKSRQGHDIMASCADKVVQDDDGDDKMIFEGNGDCMHRIENDQEIFDAHFDFPVKALDYNSAGDVSSSSTHGHETRMLDEVLPWGLEMINADKVQKGRHDIVVCVVDTGISIGHPDFDVDRIDGADNTLFFRDAWKWNQDVRGHGTKIAGILAAVGGNSIGVEGAGLKLFITRALGDDGRGYESDVIQALEQCVAARANIINLSLGGTRMGDYAREYYRHVVEDEGIMIVAAAGNDGSNAAMYPASHESVISTSAVYPWGGRWGLSNYGNQVELAAPGTRILSTSFTTSSVDNFSNWAGAVEGFHITGTRNDVISAPLMYCENGKQTCRGAQEKICLMVLETGNSLYSMLANCKEGMGVGAIVFDPESDNGISTWEVPSSDNMAAIPAMGVTSETGNKLIDKMLGETVVLGTRSDGTVLSYTYDLSSGTSFAAAHVTAAAALVWSKFGRSCSNHQIRYALAVSAQTSLGRASGCDEEYGHGIVDAQAAIDWLRSLGGCRRWDVQQISKGGCSTSQSEIKQNPRRNGLNPV